MRKKLFSFLIALFLLFGITCFSQESFAASKNYKNTKYAKQKQKQTQHNSERRGFFKKRTSDNKSYSKKYENGKYTSRKSKSKYVKQKKKNIKKTQKERQKIIKKKNKQRAKIRRKARGNIFQRHRSQNRHNKR